MNDEGRPSPFLVTHTNRYGTQRIIPCDTPESTWISFLLLTKQLGFAPHSDYSPPLFPVAIWKLHPTGLHYERQWIQPQKQHGHSRQQNTCEKDEVLR